MEWKAMEIERLNGLLIRQAAVIFSITAERDALKADAERLKSVIRYIGSVFGMDGDRTAEIQCAVAIALGSDGRVITAPKVNAGDVDCRTCAQFYENGCLIDRWKVLRGGECVDGDAYCPYPPIRLYAKGSE